MLTLRAVIQDQHSLFLAFIQKLDNYKETQTLDYLQEESDTGYLVYHFIYMDQNDLPVDLRVEINTKKKKVSYGDWGSHALSTIKISE